MTLDDIDRQIIDILRRNARVPVSEIARSIGLSSARRCHVGYLAWSAME